MAMRGPGPNNFRADIALLFWVLTGVAPDQIIATHYQNNDPSAGIVTRTMPLCPYPAVAVFTGGDVNVAANWVCQRHAKSTFVSRLKGVRKHRWTRPSTRGCMSAFTSARPDAVGREQGKSGSQIGVQTLLATSEIKGKTNEQ